MDTASYKESLLKKRAEILATGGGVSTLQETMGDVNSRQGDLADQASGNNEVHIQLKLKQTDAKILQAIEEALRRIEKGTYGICRDCGKTPSRIDWPSWSRWICSSTSAGVCPVASSNANLARCRGSGGASRSKR